MSWIGKQNVKFFLQFLHTVLMTKETQLLILWDRPNKTFFYISMLLSYSNYTQMSSAKQDEIKKCKRNWTELRRDKRNKTLSVTPQRQKAGRK